MNADALFALDQAPQETPGLRASITSVTFTAADTGWSVLRMNDGKREFHAVGNMISPTPGDSVTLFGEWTKDPKWGERFKFEGYLPELPTTAAQIKAYLGTGRIKGIGKSVAAALVEHFGERTMDVLDETPERITEVYGIGKKKAALIREGWADPAVAAQRAIGMALIAVQAPAGLAPAIWDVFGSDGARIITEQPYDLTKARGVGFTICDNIAFSLGWEKTDPRRLAAGLAYALDEAQKNGHCYLPVPELLEFAAKKLNVPAGRIADAIQLAVDNEHIVVEDDRAYSKRLHYIESDLAAHLSRLALAPLAPLDAEQADKVAALVSEQGLTDEQASIVDKVITSPLVVLTGGPGVGKSHTVGTVVAAAMLLGWNIQLCAPTGRAAQRMSELAGGAPASTIHRLLGIGGADNHTDKDADDYLNVHLLICDETSMLDITIARLLARSLATGTRVLLVGDRDQLPSVGPGAVLADVIASGIAPTVALTKIFRQVETSGIVQSAHAINAGRFPTLRGWDDLHYWPTDDRDDAAADKAADYVVDMVKNRIPAKFGIDRSDIQVLVPQRKGSCGMVQLNTRLQDAINPRKGPEYIAHIGGDQVAFRPGDRAMVVKNNYDKNLFNGTPVRVTAVNPDGGDNAVTVRTEDGQHAVYAASEIHQLALAYAITIHKSQGSQYPCVVMPVTKQAWTMLVRNLLYTGITRAQERVVLIGSPQALAKAVRTKDTATRFTGLADRLRLGEAPLWLSRSRTLTLCSSSYPLSSRVDRRRRVRCGPGGTSWKEMHVLRRRRPDPPHV